MKALNPSFNPVICNSWEVLRPGIIWMSEIKGLGKITCNGSSPWRNVWAMDSESLFEEFDGRCVISNL